MRRLKLFIPGLLCVASVLMTASSGPAATISGVIRDRVTNNPVPNATISPAGGHEVSVADADGRFSLTTTSSEVRVEVSHIGYVPLPDVTLHSGLENELLLIPTLSQLNAIVVSGNRFEETASRVPLPVATVGSQDIREKGHTTVIDAIRGLPGVDLNDGGPFRGRPVIRGVYGTRVLVLVDGERLNDHREVTDFGGTTVSLLDVNTIERVEVVNGPSSVTFGSDAMGGVINVITKNDPFNDHTTPWVTYDSRYSTVDHQTSNRVGLGLSGGDFVVSGGILQREANRDYSMPDNVADNDERYAVYNSRFYDSLNAARGTGYASDRVANSRVRVNHYDGRIAYRPADRHRLTLEVSAHRASDVGFPGVPNDSTPFFFSWPNHDRDNIAVTHRATGSSKRPSEYQTRVHYSSVSKDFFTDFYDNVSFPAGPGAMGFLETTLSHTDVSRYGLTHQQLHRPADEFKLILGLDAWREAIDGRSTTVTRFEGFGPFPIFDTSAAANVPKNSWLALGGYAVGEYHWDHLQVDAGVRWDSYRVETEETPGYVDDQEMPLPADDQTYSALTGSLGLVYPLFDVVNAVFSLGTAYRVPNTVERFYYGTASGSETRPNPDIKPERVITGNLGLKADHTNTAYSLIGFYSSYSDFTQLRDFSSDPMTGRPLWHYENVNDVVIYGLEALAELRFERGWYGRAAFSYEHGENRSENQALFVAPAKVALTAGYRMPGHIPFGEITVRHLNDQNRVPKTSALDDIATKGFTIVNATMGIDVFNGVTLAISGNNLFNQIYSEPFNGRNPDNPIPEPGRNLVISLSALMGR